MARRMFSRIAVTNTLAATTLSATATLTATLAVCWAVTAAAQTPRAEPVAPVISGGAVVGAVPLPQSRPVRLRKPERTDEAGPDLRNVVSSPPNLPVTRNPPPAREYSPQDVRFKLKALDRQAEQGLLSLEEYRVLQQSILRGQ